MPRSKWHLFDRNHTLLIGFNGVCLIGIMLFCFMSRTCFQILCRIMGSCMLSYFHTSSHFHTLHVSHFHTLSHCHTSSHFNTLSAAITLSHFHTLSAAISVHHHISTNYHFHTFSYIFIHFHTSLYFSASAQIIIMCDLEWHHSGSAPLNQMLLLEIDTASINSVLRSK